MAGTAIARHVEARHGRDYLRMLGAELERIEYAQRGAKHVSISPDFAREIAEGLRVEANALDRFSEEVNR